ncbi:MAG TPA: radical SAM/SPASM domain-containing protein [Candidatus Omnitrophota bacterium]|nr:radical SAM protein [Candidatus Omnitrophota bacterium]HQO59091.1 radical SAM/SPASM domain-containing protein [Candidatus Omnitrophota bacterium]HQP11939.1 radical SAM/SPASM domain-containing protein [Candidatus Omnitrophota bacterium]
MPDTEKTIIPVPDLSRIDAGPFPPMVVVEITNVCNLQCIHCPFCYISKEPGYQPRHMAWPLYTKIVDEVAGHPGTIFRLLCDGEPLCHPRFIDMIRYAKTQGLSPVNFITNGLLMDGDRAAAVLEARVEAVEFSLDALNKNTYERIRKGSDYETVMHHVNGFIRLRDTLKAPTKIFVSIIDQPEAEAELDAFVAYWTPRVDRVITRAYTSIQGLVDPAKIKTDPQIKRWPCPDLWRRSFINVDGFAEFCVEDWHDQSVVGDINKTTLQAVWQGPDYERLRTLHRQRRFQDVSYCAGCLDWQARDWHYDYFVALRDTLGSTAAPERREGRP